MRTVAALAIAIGFLMSPLMCAVMACDLSSINHDCCPKSQTAVACPYDVLSAAKAVPQSHDLPAVLVSTAITPEAIRSEPIALPAARDHSFAPYSLHEILRI